MPIDVDGDEDVDTNYHEHKQLKRWEHALLDLRQGHNIGCHKYCDALNVKLMYMTFGTLLWIVVGSFCFAALEHKDMQKYQKGAHDFDGMVSTLRNVSNSGVMPLPGANLNFTKRQLTHAANFMANNKPATIQWGPAGGFFFSILSMTTIGYGRFLYPQTTAGQLFVIPFTMVGIPLLAILYTAFARKSLKLVKKAVMKMNGTKSAARWQTTAISFGVFLVFLLGIGPAIFMATENWEYHESVYFVWVSVSTIGYGDFVPETTEGRTIGILMIPLGLGVCSLLLAAIVQWFEDVIVYMDYDMNSYVEWHRKQDDAKGKLSDEEGNLSEKLLKNAAASDKGDPEQGTYGSTFESRASTTFEEGDPQLRLAQALDKLEETEDALHQSKLETAETLTRMTNMLADAMAAKEAAEAALQAAQTAQHDSPGAESSK